MTTAASRAWRLWALLVAFAIALCAAPARAQRGNGRPEVSASIDSDTIALGDVLTVTLQANADSMPSDPQVGRAAPGFSVHGPPSIGTSASIRIVNGVTTAMRGLTATWRLRAERIGTFVVGPPSILIDGVRHKAEAFTVTVVEPGKAPRRAPPRPAQPSPFDPFGGLFDFHGFDEPAQPEVTPDPRLALDMPRDAVAFLHATVDKTRAVVGEQVTYTVLYYFDANERAPEFNDVHEATAPDFLKRSLQENDQQAPLLGYAMIAGRPWGVRLLRKTALFPLKAGDLEIQPMSLAILSRGGSALRQSETLKVRVTEPPLAGRPPGYAVGDVGSFTLAATVNPRTVEREGAVGVTVELSGTGNLPATITPPQRAGVEWLDPQVTEKVGALDGDVFGGRRTFNYVVRMHREGEIDLGELALPYWNPRTNRYEIARAALGTVHVTPGAAAAASAQAAPDPLPGLPPLRTTMSGARAATTYVTDSGWAWLALALPALAFAIVTGAREAATQLRARRDESAASPRTELKTRIAAATHLAHGGDAGALDAATARALEAAAIAHASVNVRGVETSRVAAALEERGVAADVAREVEALLRACQEARFSGASGVDDARDRWARARRAIERMERR